MLKLARSMATFRPHSLAVRAAFEDQVVVLHQITFDVVAVVPL